MKIFTVHPGASTSTADVYAGVTRGLKALGHDVVRFNLEGRLTQSGSWLKWCYKNAKKSGMDVEKPNFGDVLYHAHSDILLKYFHHDCEFILLFSGMYTPLYFLRIIRKAGIKVGIVFTESPYNDRQQSEYSELADVCWTNERTSLDLLRVANKNTFYLPHAYDTDVHLVKYEKEDAVRAHDVVFVGTGWQERVDLLSGVDWDGIDLGLYGNWAHLGSRSPLRKFLRGGEIPNEVSASLYRTAKIGLNLYRRSTSFGRYPEYIDSAESLSPRAYELAACGLFHLSERRKELAEVFGDLVPTFDGPAELEEKIRFYLAHPEDRQRIAAALPAAVKGQTWTNRAAQIVDQIEETLGVNENVFAIGG